MRTKHIVILWTLAFAAFLIALSLDYGSSKNLIVLNAFVGTISVPIIAFVISLIKKYRWLRYGVFGALFPVAIGVALVNFRGDLGIALLLMGVWLPVPSFIVFSIIGALISKKEMESGEINKSRDFLIPSNYWMSLGAGLTILGLMLSGAPIAPLLWISGIVCILISSAARRIIKNFFMYFVR